jgi:hypothetical protein
VVHYDTSETMHSGFSAHRLGAPAIFTANKSLSAAATRLVLTLSIAGLAACSSERAEKGAQTRTGQTSPAAPSPSAAAAPTQSTPIAMSDTPAPATPTVTPAEPSAAPAQEAPWTTKRVGGDLFALPERIEQGGEVMFRSGASFIDTPLPVGYPAPTPPGAIELKKYPIVRRAEISATDINTDGGRNIAFFPLFNHIKERDIAMTSPVEMDYPDLRIETVQEPAGNGSQNNWTMSFLYREPTMGKTGEAGRVRVVDREALTVLSLGMRGNYSSVRDTRGLSQLRDWLMAQNEWEAAGPARAFYYNGPSQAPQNSWSEIQVPVRRKDEI